MNEPDVGELIALYLETRDMKTAVERKQKLQLKKYTAILKRIEGILMHQLQEKNLQSLSSGDATAYITHKSSASIVDAVAFQGYVIENRAWDMLDWKANVTAVKDFVAEHDILPPGVNLTTNVSLGVMRK